MKNSADAAKLLAKRIMRYAAPEQNEATKEEERSIVDFQETSALNFEARDKSEAFIYTEAPANHLVRLEA